MIKMLDDHDFMVFSFLYNYSLSQDQYFKPDWTVARQS